MIPVVYIHFGNHPEYLIKSVEQALVYNKEVILISDKEWKKEGVKNISPAKYNEGIDAFLKVYQHKSTNAMKFELMCINRWFVLRNVMNALDIPVCYYSDSDGMLYDNMEAVYKNYSEYEASYTYTEMQDNYRWSASACCSFWKRETLNKFCDFIMELYTPEKINVLEEKWKYHQINNIGGGVCDMTLLYLFSKQIKFYPLSKVMNDFCFDQNMRVSENYFPDEYEMQQRVKPARKKVKWKNNQPYGFNKVLNKEIRFVTLTEYPKIMIDEAERKNIMKRIFIKLVPSLYK